jgi:hypothetical protein
MKGQNGYEVTRDGKCHVDFVISAMLENGIWKRSALEGSPESIL